MRDVEPPDVAVAAPAEVINLFIVRTHRAERFGAHKIAVVVVMHSAVVEVCKKAPLRRIARPDEILPIQVCDDHFLVAGVERVQFRVRVLLAHVEDSEIVLVKIVVPIAEEPRTEVHVVEKKSAKVRVERLVADAQRNKIVIVRQILEMKFHEPLLQREKSLRALRACAGVKAACRRRYRRDLAQQQRADVAGV